MAAVGRLLEVSARLFAAAVLTSCASGSPAATATGGASSGADTQVVVSLLLVPVCGPSSPAPSGCEPEALPGVLVVVVRADGAPAGEERTDSDGRAVFHLAAGRYVATGATVPGAVPPRPVAVAVTGEEPVTATIRYESNLQ